MTARGRKRPLLVRLPNHLGDTLMTLPALERLAAAGHALTLVGKGWAKSVFAAYPWPVEPVPADFGASVRQWRELAARTGARNAVLFTNSLRTALVARLGGLAADGYATDARRWLLARAVPLPERWRTDMHMVEYYDALVATLLHAPARTVPPLALKLTDAARQGAARLLAGACIASPYVVLCPGATGRHRGRDKTWPHFAQLTQWLLERGETVVALPGPGERARFEAALPGATCCPKPMSPPSARCCKGSRLVIANDSGPGHLAAAVDAKLLSLFGVTEVEKTRPWGAHVTVLGSFAGWPAFDEVTAAIERSLG
jgi:heptosyltransferase II